MALLKSLWNQYFPSKPNFTENDVPDQSGRVFLVTGCNSGVGFELVKMLYPTGAKIYMAGRSEERINIAIKEITAVSVSNPATLKFLHCDLNDLDSVKTAAETFAKQEETLDVLWQNAGVGGTKGLATKQNIEGHIGVNCVAPLLLSELLISNLRAAASQSGSARIIWTGSALTEVRAPNGGIDFDLIDAGASTDPYTDYAASKVGNYWLATECARRYGQDGIISLCQNPGNLRSQFYRSQPGWMMFFVNMALHEPKFGAYTALYSAFTSDVTATQNNGSYIWPWGVLVNGHSRSDINDAALNGQAERFWEWCESKYSDFK